MPKPAVDPTGHRHSSRREPKGHRSDVDDAARLTDRLQDMKIDPHHHSTKNGCDDRRAGAGSKSHPTQVEVHGTRGTPNLVNNAGSDYHSPWGGKDGKRSTHHQEKTEMKIKLRETLFRQALQPFNKNTGAPYPSCSQTDIDFHHQNVFQKPNKGPFVSAEEATKEILWHNDARRSVTPAEKAAIDRLLKAGCNAVDKFVLSPDLAVKAFSDLDLVFFGGRLRGHVIVRWLEERNFDKKTYTNIVWGSCVPRRGGEGQCRVMLNASMIYKDAWTRSTPNPSESMIGTLLHELCHAYEMIRSSRNVESREGHGKLFGTRISVVHKRAMRVLGLWAIERGEPHRQHHIFVPFCEQSEQSVRDDRGGGRSGSSKHIHCSEKDGNKSNHRGERYHGSGKGEYEKNNSGEKHHGSGKGGHEKDNSGEKHHDSGNRDDGRRNGNSRQIDGKSRTVGARIRQRDGARV